MTRPYLVRILIGAGVLGALALFMATLDYPWNWWVPWRYRSLFLWGFVNTMVVSVGAICMGFVIGVLGGLARVSKSVVIRTLAGYYVELFRGTPLLVQIYIFYFCLAAVIHYDNPMIIGMVTLAFFSGAYITEMVRAGIESIDPGQVEAAKSTGLNERQTMRYVIFPQAFRRIIPPVTGQFVSLIKDSSLLSVISVRELTKASEVVNATTYKTFEAYLPLAVLYLVLTYPLSYMTQRLEQKLSNGRK
ncbi:polar amino acid transport system permease protein [Desulfacinum infernum DSM 9756]|uniref:Putative glutamine transport system permease protein GlnP n=1 Tax=Desulfacinum infernum DSM 9756 TaxID=1121391 RepID=A0A1M5BT35_9BACT|nr:amino acid ABC transporter permease [Desulfacinum infernum]SHF45412.1 polar amino acid transport system permease protein [Desulfacinum infernum DSM 9756]